MLERRALISGAVILAAGFSGGNVSASAREGEGSTVDTSMMDACIGLCLDTHRKCLEAARLVAAYLDRPIATTLIATLTDCAEICQTTANSMIRGSSLHTIMCDACARACRHCAEECGRLSDARFARCAESCRVCAASCETMATMPH